MTPQLKELDDKIKALLAEYGHTLVGVPVFVIDGQQVAIPPGASIQANVMYAEVVQPEPTGKLSDPA